MISTDAIFLLLNNERLVQTMLLQIELYNLWYSKIYCRVKECAKTESIFLTTDSTVLVMKIFQVLP